MAHRQIFRAVVKATKPRLQKSWCPLEGSKKTFPVILLQLRSGSHVEKCFSIYLIIILVAGKCKFLFFFSSPELRSNFNYTASDFVAFFMINFKLHCAFFLKLPFHCFIALIAVMDMLFWSSLEFTPSFNQTQPYQYKKKNQVIIKRVALHAHWDFLVVFFKIYIFIRILKYKLP